MIETAQVRYDWQLHNYAFGEPRARGLIKARCEDFRVDEIALIEPDGAGEHLWVHLQKTGANTQWVAARLAEALAVAPREVSFAGRKDRYAVCTQWFSARIVGTEPKDWEARLPVGIKVLTARRHGRKLRRGTLRGNRFRIVIRELGGEVETLAERVAHIRAEGVPNFFGEQRFGRDGANLAAAHQLFSGRRGRLTRARREMYFSAARAQIFNAVLAHRVADASWNQLLLGDVAALDGTRSVFPVAEVDEELGDRNAALDVHPSGPLWGRGSPSSTLAVQKLEMAIAARHPVLADGLAAGGVQQARRALRIKVNDLRFEFGEGAATVSFSLPAGSYATAVLREVLQYETGPAESGPR